MGSKSYSKGISWFDDCRIPFVDEGDSNKACKSDKEIIEYTKDTIWEKSGVFNYKRTGGNTQGRFPANLLVCDDMLNDGIISKAGEYKGNGSKSGGIWNKSTGKPAGLEYGDKGTNSRYYNIDKWFDNIISE
jgi:hypothetical protein